MNPVTSRLIFLAGLLGASLCGEPTPAQQTAWPQGSPPPNPSTRHAPAAAYGEPSRGLQKLSLRLATSAPSSPQLVISGGQPGSFAFLLAGSARTAGPRQLDSMEQVRADVVVPIGSFDASGSAAMQIGDLASSSSGSTVWLQATSTDGTSSPPCLLAALVAAQVGIRAPARGEWCWTQQQYIRSNPAAAINLLDFCPELGPCDNLVARDAAIPTGTTPIKTVRLGIHVFCEDNGSNCAATPGDVAAAVGRLNADFAPWRIQFVYQTNFIDKTKYRYLDISTNRDPWQMKLHNSDSPATQLNVYVVDTGGGSWGTFPWTADALDKQGGIVMDDTWFVAATPLPSIFTHEVGHCLGLWHTFHGVTEVTQCSDCYEAAGRSVGSGDVTGDKCSDTEPTTNHNLCADPAGLDPCSSNPWAATPWFNYMGYSNSCAITLTAQQAGRMHCWTDAVLSGWLQVPAGLPAAPSGLAATVFSSSRIDLAWTDNATNENGFDIERSLSGASSWALIANVGANVTSFQDTGLTASTTYDYRVRAINTGGNSAFSNTATATTNSPGQPGDATANQDIPVSGTVSGSYVDTEVSDDGYESITERESGGKPSNRYSFLEHKWAITVLPGTSFSFHVEAHRTTSNDGDNFVFAWSSDDQTYTDMVTVTKTVDDDIAETFALPNGLSGTVYIRVSDTDRTRGNRALDTISIDHMFVRSL